MKIVFTGKTSTYCGCKIGYYIVDGKKISHSMNGDGDPTSPKVLKEIERVTIEKKKLDNLSMTEIWAKMQNSKNKKAETK